jgi:hypothetical protein
MVSETRDPDPIDVAPLAKTFAGKACRHDGAVDDEAATDDNAMGSVDLEQEVLARVQDTAQNASAGLPEADLLNRQLRAASCLLSFPPRAARSSCLSWPNATSPG